MFVILGRLNSGVKGCSLRALARLAGIRSRISGSTNVRLLLSCLCLRMFVFAQHEKAREECHMHSHDRRKEQEPG